MNSLASTLKTLLYVNRHTKIFDRGSFCDFLLKAVTHRPSPKLVPVHTPRHTVVVSYVQNNFVFERNRDVYPFLFSNDFSFAVSELFISATNKCIF